MLSAGEERPYSLYAMSLAMVGSIAAMAWDRHLVEMKKGPSQRSAPAAFLSNGSAAHTVLRPSDEAATGSTLATSLPSPRFDDATLPLREAQPASVGDSSPIDTVSPTVEPTDPVVDPLQSDHDDVASRDTAPDDSSEHSTESSETDQTLPAPRFETSELHPA